MIPATLKIRLSFLKVCKSVYLFLKFANFLIKKCSSDRLFKNTADKTVTFKTNFNKKQYIGLASAFILGLYNVSTNNKLNNISKSQNSLQFINNLYTNLKKKPFVLKITPYLNLNLSRSTAPTSCLYLYYRIHSPALRVADQFGI